MFRPDLKETGWDVAPEVVFEITGDRYSDILPLNFEHTLYEKELSNILNNSLMEILWDSISITELENHFEKEIEDSNSFGEFSFRLEFPGDCIYGWVHYRPEKKIETFRFKIGLDGSFNKC